MGNKQQFLPTLIDRLIDNEPKKQFENFDSTFFDGKAMRSLVVRDLMALLNCTNIERELNPERHKHVAKAVINYGVSSLIGMSASLNNWITMERSIRDAILRFEPRIIPESLFIRTLRDSSKHLQGTIVRFELCGLIYWEPYPLDLCVSVNYDRERESIESNNSY